MSQLAAEASVETAGRQPEQRQERQSGSPADGLIMREPPRTVRGRAYDGHWVVHLRRQGRNIRRAFTDGVYGSAEASHAMALAYREALLAAFPPQTNREAAAQPHRNNQSGVAGVYREKRPKEGSVYWVAYEPVKRGRRRYFSVVKYGEDRAKALAVAQRQKWVAALPGAFHRLVGAPTAAAAERHFTERLALVPSVARPTTPLSAVEFEARLAEINVRFDALRPAQLKVHVFCSVRGEYHLAISDAVARGARSRLVWIGCKDRSVADVVATAAVKVEAAVGTLYGEAVARWFMDGHGKALLDAKRFDPQHGFKVKVFVPAPLATAWQSKAKSLTSTLTDH